MTDPKKAATLRKRVFICSPYRADSFPGVAANVLRARDYCEEAIKKGFAPFAPHLFYTRIFDDDNPADRATGIACGIAWLSVCDELWAFQHDGNEPTPGMAAEIAEAKRLGIQVRYFARDDS